MAAITFYQVLELRAFPLPTLSTVPVSQIRITSGHRHGLFASVWLLVWCNWLWQSTTLLDKHSGHDLDAIPVIQRLMLQSASLTGSLPLPSPACSPAPGHLVAYEHLHRRIFKLHETKLVIFAMGMAFDVSRNQRRRPRFFFC